MICDFQSKCDFKVFCLMGVILGTALDLYVGKHTQYLICVSLDSFVRSCLLSFSHTSSKES